ncbi:SDR family oxidoreductase [Streptomyces liangshanensis]|uniref:SDR family oxidoreductase n=1 Tax=Streptomyces liangshanensis TaxID=2717324 RepID=A0A6G9H0T2_9ACTN|nr:SDR family oxidoreductase [Streptomyces liangshanensis]QIQ04138.1 SDR family oxidoreductase [Streptomyces liangshanensis]
MNINGSVAFVTGGNRGLGAQLVRALLEAGASKVYAAARDPRTVAEGAVPIRLDVTDHASVVAAAEQAQDVTLLVNNAGIHRFTTILGGELDDVRREFETNALGTLDVTRAFAPVLGRNGGGAILNVLSVLSWASLPTEAGYGAAKAAQWSFTNALRVELAGQGTQVSALHMGRMDTDMIAGKGIEGAADPADIARIALEGVEKGRLEIIADGFTQQIKDGLSLGIEALYPQVGAPA